jgi:hypothetical protein
LRGLVELARSAGGEPPLPACPSTTEIEDLQRKVGNEQLVAVKDRASDFETKINAWTALRELAATRKAVWDLVERLGRQAKDLPAAQPILDQLNAIREQRSLLAPSDSVGPLRLALAHCLREAVNQASEAHSIASEKALSALAENEVWKKLPPADQTAIQQTVGLIRPTKPEIASDEALAGYVESRPLSTHQTEIDAVAGRLQHAIEQAAKKLEPQVQPVAVERVTLRTENDVHAWLERTKVQLVDAVRRGPVLVK